MAIRKDIKSNKYYIVDTGRLDRRGKPKLLRKEFDNAEQVKMNLKKLLADDLRFDWIKGSEAIELGLIIMKNFQGLGFYLKKYNYSNIMTTEQEKKSYRTKYRRHQRRKKGNLFKRKY